MEEKNPAFFSSFESAEKAYSKYREIDPFPAIPPALLNSADIADYVRMTGMIYPFYMDDLQGATYNVRLKGLCVYYTEEQRDSSFSRHIFCVGQDDSDMPHAEKNKSMYEVKNELRLAPNSITFITLEPVFQVPDYFALRFNLKISHIYKGLLLGTGPIIDPGFQGRLSIPLHNLTSRDYIFHENDQIITLEFTKMSPYRMIPEKMKAGRKGEYKQTNIPMHRQVTDYLGKALGEYNSDGIVSSVIGSTEKAKRVAKSAKRHALTAEKIANEMGSKIDKQSQMSIAVSLIGIIVALVVAFFTLMLPSYQLIQTVTDTQSDYKKAISELERKVDILMEERSTAPDDETDDVRVSENMAPDI